MQSCKICIFHSEPPPILFKVVQGERRTKCKAARFAFFIPSRRLTYPKIVQGERRTKCKAAGFAFFIPSRRLTYPKIV